tara:strand:- start:873 stop:1382 length:510 start_codon:yes stop_codon:yes gene_type:complete
MAGLSIDQGGVEDLRKLTAFFNFISNPDAYKELLATTAKTLGKMEETVAAYTTVEQANAYLAQIQAKISETNEFVRMEQAKIQAQREAEVKKVVQAEAKLADREQLVAAAETSLRDKATELKLRSNGLDARDVKLREAEQYVANARTFVDEQKADLAMRAAKLRELAGV